MQNKCKKMLMLYHVIVKRVKLHMTQDEFAELVGINRKIISQIENVPDTFLRSISEKLNVNILWLKYGIVHTLVCSCIIYLLILYF